MLELRPVRGACFVQGGGGSDRCERVVPTLRRQARLKISLNRESYWSANLTWRFPGRAEVDLGPLILCKGV